MSHFSDFMDGVPVKISERYKRPPRIELPYSVSECTSRAQAVVENSVYCPTFETNVLSKIKELKNAKHTKKNESRHRVQLLEEAKQKKLDAIATAEAEEKLKQLSVSEVSYPSTDEISALSPDDNPDKTCDLTPTKDSSPELQINNTDVNMVTYNNIQEQQSNILQPIQVQSNYNQHNSLLDDPDPLQELTRSAKITKIHQFNHNIEALTVKDFENDTSSPFDNVELKTINEMELLAQVLQSQRDSQSSCDIPITYNQAHIYNEIPGCVAQPDTFLPNSYPSQSIPNSVPMYPSPHHFPTTNGYYMPTENACDNMVPMENVNMYMPNYQYYIPINPYGTDPTYDYQPPLQQVTHNLAINPSSTYIPQPYYFSQSQIPPPTATYNPVPLDNTIAEKSLSPIQVKSRSRSVPDIVRELDEQTQLAAEERVKASIQIDSPTPNVRPSCSKQTKDERLLKKKTDVLPNPYDKLTPKLQSMCQKIQGMGFPLDRVARVCTLVGDNDKKIIEGLLIVGDLMDLGFSERKVSAALAKHEFNRDKALDELVS